MPPMGPGSWVRGSPERMGQAWQTKQSVWVLDGFSGGEPLPPVFGGEFVR